MIILSKQSVYFNVEEMTQPSDTKKIKKGVDLIHGVISVSVNYETKNVAVDFDSTGTNSKQILHEIEKMGYFPQLINQVDHIM